MANPFASAARLMRPTPVQRAIYGGAAGGRLHADWTMYRLSANTALQGSIQVLRDRARELVNNNATATRAPQLFSENVIGKDGITLQAAVPNTRNGTNDATSKKIEAAWYRWAEAQTASVDRSASWVDLQTMIVENEAIDGEVLIRLVRGFNNPFGFAIELLDPDQLDHTLNITGLPNGNSIRLGVEIDPWGGPVAYHLWKQHPSEVRGQQRERVDASQIIHLFIQRRPQQRRGVTWFAPVVVDLHMHGGFREASLVNARVAASSMGFLRPDPETASPPPPPQIDPQTGQVPAVPRLTMEADPGLIQELPLGYSLETFDPHQPNTAFESFDTAVLHSVASGLRLPFMELTGKVGEANYSSARIGSLAARAVYERLQQRFIERVCDPVYRAWLRMAMTTGALDVGSFDATRYESVVWHPRAFPWVDPEKDLAAAEREVAMGLTSLTRLAAERGRDIEDVLQERKKELERAAELGVPLSIGLPPAKTLGPPAPQDPGAAPDNSTNPTNAARPAMRLIGEGA